MQARRAACARRGLRRQFLPAYCPELNKIEVLWHRLKHYWLSPDDYRSDQSLRDKLDQVLYKVGTEYTIIFS